MTNLEDLRKAAALMRDEGSGCSTHGCPWHGLVAIAVADLLEDLAFRAESDPNSDAALAMPVARAYLETTRQPAGEQRCRT